jgi:hypothetical protein
MFSALIIDDPQFTGVRLAMAGWEDGLLLRRHEDACWAPEPADPGFPLVPILARAHDGSDLARVRDSIPADLLLLAAPFPEWQWTALWMFRHNPFARQLCESSPNLFWLVLDGWQQRPEPEVDALFRLPRTDLVRFATGQHAHRRHLAFLQKFRAERRDRPSLEALRAGLSNDDVVRFYAHARTVTPRMVTTALKHRPLLGLAAFADAARRGEDAINDCAMYVRDIGRMSVADPTDRIRAARTLEALGRLHDLQELEYRERALHQPPLDPEAPFPRPPFPSTETIVALRCPRELAEEGRHMRHCAAAYAPVCAAGRNVLYRVLAPERATLELVRGLGMGGWRVGQVKGVRNARVSTETWDAVEAWLAGHRVH